MGNKSHYYHQQRRLYSSNARNNFYITTPIFYVNAEPHIGHLYTSLLADALKKFQEMQGKNTYLCTGTDEHGSKVAEAAAAAKIPPISHCDKMSSGFKLMCDKFDVNYTDFIRTTEQRHQRVVQKFWMDLVDRGEIYEGKYSGWYCVSDEAYLSPAEMETVKTDRGTIHVSKETGNVAEFTEERTYKFSLRKYKDDLLYWMKGEPVKPRNYQTVLMQILERDVAMEDLSVSRPVERVSWGIPVPNDPSQTIYVWFDALINYLTTLGYPDPKFKEFWPANVQIIGKDILRFHGIYWPALLMASGLEPPRTLLCHSHWTIDAVKMSKSIGNVVSPFAAANTYTEEGLRYFLLREAVPHNDSNYSEEKVRKILNSELASTFGNTIRRCTSAAINKNGKIPNLRCINNVVKSQHVQELKEALSNLQSEAHRCYESYNLHHVVDASMSTLRLVNVMIDREKPWSLVKNVNSAEDKEMLDAVISLSLEAARINALVLYPIVPSLCTRVLDLLQVPMSQRTWQDVKPRYLEQDKIGESEDIPSDFVLFNSIKK